MKKELPSGWKELQIKDVLDYERPDLYIVKNNIYKDKGVAVLTANKSFILGYTDEKDNIYNNIPVIIFDDFTTETKYVNFPFKVKSSAIKILKSKKGYNLKFIYEVLNIISFNCKVHKRYYISEYQNLNILVPPLDEQKRIADILSTFDDLIENLNKLIAKKEIYKKGVMQRVLSGKVRFEGFTDEWETVKLKDILIAGSKDRVPDTSKYKKITIKLHNKGIEFSNIERKMADKRPFYIRKKDEIIIGKQNYFNGSIAIVDEEFDNTICSNAIMSFTVNEDCNNKFIYFLLSRKSYMQKYYHLANGTGQKELSESDFLNFNLLIPSLEEQNKIAELLSLIDQDIDSLKQILHLRRLQKKGVMQKLLTGEVRV
ncbi:restriction endonuclease subunit S [uncultured Brachyspira sp.]|uniref:restriction endonuclease subunit S n=1 Tax=uncultured Brachyspira sp. TaxID=221953 RepID=UPI0025F20268|nr:restriction endonuclease subunit S [uncultured Brachyspira sp.]